MSSKNKDERAYTNILVKAIQENTKHVYAYVDRDSGTARHTSSGWDFLLATNGTVVFCEAKIEKKPLSPWQKLVKALIQLAKTTYNEVRYDADGEFFTVNGGKRIAILDAKFEDFLEGLEND
jgi:hypothetical protein